MTRPCFLDDQRIVDTALPGVPRLMLSTNYSYDCTSESLQNEADEYPTILEDFDNPIQSEANPNHCY